MADQGRSGEQEAPTQSSSSQGGWLGLAAVAVVILGFGIANRQSSDESATSTATSESATSSSHAAEATDLYNSYIAAARLCRSEGEGAIQKTSGSDVLAAYEALLRAQRTCDESANRIADKRPSDGLDQATNERLSDLHAESVRTHRLLARVYGKIAKAIDRGGDLSAFVEARDLLAQGKSAEEYCHTELAAAVKSVGGEVWDR